MGNTMNKYKTELNWGFIFVASLLIWMLLERLLDLHDEHFNQHMIYTNLFAILAIALYVFALREKRKKDYNGVIATSRDLFPG